MPRAKRATSAYELQQEAERLRERQREEDRARQERRARERRELQERHRAALAAEHAKRGAVVYALLTGPDGPAVSAFLLPRVPDHARAFFQAVEPATPSSAKASTADLEPGMGQATRAQKGAVMGDSPVRDLWDGSA